MFNLFKKKQEPTYDVTDLKITDLDVGFIFDYDLKSWVVREKYEYDWGGNNFSHEYKVDSGDAAGGVDHLKRAIERRPRDIDALTCAGQGFSALGRTNTALRYFERAIAVSPSYTPAVIGAAKMSAKLGRTSQAVSHYRRVLELDPSTDSMASM